MLVKPVAFKGPSDHLSQFFAKDLLFRGLTLLLSDALKNWQYDKNTQVAKSQFAIVADAPTQKPSDPTNVETQISWPLQTDSMLCNCQSNSSNGQCEHLAALALESKRRLDGIDYHLKDVLDERHLWPTTEKWIDSQAFDPYPNMARHRVLYLLKKENNQFYIQIYKGYRTTEKKYLLKQKLPLSSIKEKKLPKFFTVTDRLIFSTYLDSKQKEIDLESSIFSLYTLPTSIIDKLLEWMLDSQRLFWKSASLSPIKKTNFNKTQLQVNDNHELSINNWLGSYLVDYSNNRIISVTQEPTTTAPISEEIVISPRITVSTSIVDLPLINESLLVDVGQIDFLTSNGNLKYEDVFFCQSEKLKSKVAFFIRQLQSFPTLSACYEKPIVEMFSAIDRSLLGDPSSLFVWLLGLKHAGWQIDIHSDYQLNRKQVESIKFTFAQNKEQIETKILSASSNETINLTPLLKSILSQSSSALESKNNSLLLREENGRWLEFSETSLQTLVLLLKEIFAKAKDGEQHISLTKAEFLKLHTLNQHETVIWEAPPALRKQLSVVNSIELPDWNNSFEQLIKAELREYQKQGVQWLLFLKKYGLGGLLSDDMGLGKTIQVLSFFSVLLNENEDLQFLVVAPTSLLGNWQDEIRRFIPHITSHIHYGARRSTKVEDIKTSSIIITSYGTLQRDITLFAKVGFSVVVLDEAQAIKNAATKVAKDVARLSAKMRIGLSGTPIENHLGELWSLFNFIMPGFLGNQTQFNKWFRKPIEQEQNDEALNELRQRINPFMLRRTKAQVAPELPDKTELTKVFELTERQAELYESIRLSTLESVQKIIQQNSSTGSSIQIANAILRLRQICCDPRLLQLGEAKNNQESAKLAWLKQVVPQLIDEGRSLLIFSSFTSMLDIISKEFSDIGVEHLILTGKTRNRKALIDQFQSAKSKVFLISLKAGGVGLNLTRADTVIHYDPWWNPAAEEQASDRAHRIGQTQAVFIYKLLTRDTVEERIYELQRSKKQLTQMVTRATSDFNRLFLNNWSEILKPISD